jgi:hypothetical protein
MTHPLDCFIGRELALADLEEELADGVGGHDSVFSLQSSAQQISTSIESAALVWEKQIPRWALGMTIERGMTI